MRVYYGKFECKLRKYYWYMHLLPRMNKNVKLVIAISGKFA